MQTDFWYLVCSADEEVSASQWVSGRQKARGRNARSVAYSEGKDALDGGDDGDETSVIVASKEDGSDAKRYTLTLRVEVDYDMGDEEDVDFELESFADNEDEESDDGAERAKGCEDDQTLSLF